MADVPLVTNPEPLWERIRRVKENLLIGRDPRTTLDRGHDGIIFPNLGRRIDRPDEIGAGDAAVPRGLLSRRPGDTTTLSPRDPGVLRVYL